MRTGLCASQETAAISLIAGHYTRCSNRPHPRRRPRPRKREKYNGIEDEDEDEPKNELNPHPANLK